MLRKSRIVVILAVLLCGVVLLAQAAAPNVLESVVVDGADSESPYATWQSNRFAHKMDNSVNTVNSSLDGFTLVTENENLALYINEDEASIRVQNKKNGYVWGGLSEEQAANMNDTWTAFANSIVSIEYLNTGANIKKIGAGDDDATTRFSYEDNKIICAVSFKKIGIFLTATVELTDDSVVFSVDDKSIQERNEEYFLANLYFCPFLGATYGNEIPGYMFVPDGSGALIRYKAPTEYLTGYSARVYGLDYAIDNLLVVNNLGSTRPNDFAKSEETISMPIYGIVHGNKQNALFGHIKNGAEYASVFATPAGLYTDFNWCGSYFIYHQVYQQPIERGGAGIQVVQKDRNNVDPKLSVYLLENENADYIGMANLYSEILTDAKMLPETLSDTPTLSLDFVMEDLEEGFLFNTKKTITNLEYVENAVKALGKEGLDDLHVSLLGWQKGGLYGYKKDEVYKKGTFGSLKNLGTLTDILGPSGQLSLYTDYLRAREPQIGSQKDAAISLSQSPITTTRENRDAFLPMTYYLKYPDSLQHLLKQNDAFTENKIGTPLIDGGNLLYGEYLTDEFVSRSDVLDQITKTFKNLAKEEKLTIFSPNEYLYAYMDQYRNVPMSASQYLFEDDSVPFLQMVLSGKVTMFAPYANDSFYSKTSVLKCIEYNCYPSFLLTEEDNYEIKKTVIGEYSSTQFDDWKGTIVEIYDLIDDVLSQVHGKRIDNHTVIEDGIVAVDYEGGTRVVINYRSEDYNWQGTVIPALSAVCQNN